MRAGFGGATTLTIAHRVRTVLDCDRVLVMAAGRVIEDGPPRALAADPASAFHAMASAEAAAAGETPPGGGEGPPAP